MKGLIVFFSRKGENYVSGSIQDLLVGNTERVAEYIKGATGADLFALEMETPYSFYYNDCIEEARKDKEKNILPKLKSIPKSVEEYHTIYLGYPNYWGTMPMPVFTFLSMSDFSGKVIKPFCTHEGSGFGSSLSDIQAMCPNAIVSDGLSVYGSQVEKSKNEIEEWAKVNFKINETVKENAQWNM